MSQNQEFCFRSKDILVEQLVSEGVARYIGGGLADGPKDTINAFKDLFKHDWPDIQKVINGTRQKIREDGDVKVAIGGSKWLLDLNNTHHNWAHIYVLNDQYYDRVKKTVKTGDNSIGYLNADFKARKLDSFIGSPSKVSDLGKLLDKFESRVKELSKISQEGNHYAKMIAMNGARTLDAVITGIIRISK